MAPLEPAPGIAIRLDGEPVIAGTGFPVRAIRTYEVPSQMATVLWVLEDWPGLTPPQVYTALRYYEDHKFALWARDEEWAE